MTNFTAIRHLKDAVRTVTVNSFRCLYTLMMLECSNLDWWNECMKILPWVSDWKKIRFSTFFSSSNIMVWMWKWWVEMRRKIFQGLLILSKKFSPNTNLAVTTLATYIYLSKYLIDCSSHYLTSISIAIQIWTQTVPWLNPLLELCD